MTLSRTLLSASKRLGDVMVASVALIILCPFILVMALAVKIDSPGPGFYSQQRLGRGRRPFTLHKLRTMINNAERMGPALTKGNDQRITRVGRFLRRYHLDELPQLWNVVKGEMSLVGPRPEREFFADRIAQREPLYERLFSVRPGLTSLGIVSYGYASSVDEMIERMVFDLHYIDTIGLSTDLKILFKTLTTVATGKGL